MEEKFAISIYVCNKPGVLVRLTQTFARRGYNIDSLVVSPAHNTAFSRITVVVQGEPSSYNQILRQLNKLVDVVHAASHESTDVVDREMALFKVKVDPKMRAEIFQIVEVFRAKTVDITDQSLVIETTGDSLKIDALEKLLGRMGLAEMVRSGKLIMKRGIEET